MRWKVHVGTARARVALMWHTHTSCSKLP
jgi:hypothetical protein